MYRKSHHSAGIADGVEAVPPFRSRCNAAHGQNHGGSGSTPTASLRRHHVPGPSVVPHADPHHSVHGPGGTGPSRHPILEGRVPPRPASPPQVDPLSPSASPRARLRRLSFWLSRSALDYRTANQTDTKPEDPVPAIGPDPVATRRAAERLTPGTRLKRRGL